ncbi:hypothetical protein [Vibrio japonicus]|uniref:Uncharacterized protein n=1 Tax=Vibrio japonicus TaxID=1824638 RepID=A0ABY5LF20_9VIBR|nr:hypothetical protein [Vibrio japonicus]UUM29541.1 hypothetical protein NP165_07345 [Vibrio japonicus]
MKWILSKFLLSTVILACCSQANSQTYDQIVYARIKAIAPNLKYFAKERLPKSERHLVDGLKIKVDRRNLVNASAGTNALGRKQITLYNGIVLTIDLLSQIAVLSQEYPDCARAYLSYMYKEYFKNTGRSVRGLKVNNAQTPPGFFGNFPGCRDAGRFLMQMPREHGLLYREFVEASLMMLFLHELAHIKYQHSGNVSTQQSRVQEAQADKWALERLPLFYDDPGLALPLMLHLSLTNGQSLEDEESMTHPLGIKRMLLVLDEVIPNIEDEDVAFNMSDIRGRLEDIIYETAN